MKKIKVKILGHPLTDTFSYSYYILTTLKKYYEVELSEDPEYLFFHDSTYEHCNYKCIKIFYTGENISPDFNTCDYAIGSDYISFEDRYYRLPLYLVTVFFNTTELLAAGQNYLGKQKIFTENNLQEKSEFCSFVYSNYRAEVERKKIFTLLNSYKKVNSAGSYLNNTGGAKIKNKLDFESKHKFSVAFENSSRSGYTTEKLVNSLVAKTIPIYWGNPNVGKEFNSKRFINCHEYKSFDDVLKRVEELDANDELYLQAINEPIANENYHFDEVKKGFDTFLRSIIDQPLIEASRKTINPVKQIEIARRDRLMFRDVQKRSYLLKISAILYKPFKKISFFEKMKHTYFSNKK